MTPQSPEVLFLCVHNAGRSQMAAALTAHHGDGRVVVHSAGTDPAQHLNPAVVKAMTEVGIDISAQRPRPLTDENAVRADVIITMGCGDSCPVYPGKRYLDWALPDPTGRSLEEVRLIRDQIDRLVRELVRELAP
jgi:arsenate reductase (thioredoxin)